MFMATYVRHLFNVVETTLSRGQIKTESDFILPIRFYRNLQRPTLLPLSDPVAGNPQESNLKSPDLQMPQILPFNCELSGRDSTE